MNPFAIFLSSRYGRGLSTEKIKTLQAKGMKNLRTKVMPQSPFYASYAERPMHEWPVMNKSQMMANFSAINTVGLNLDDALEAALASEKSRTVATGYGGVALGLSTGTSGQRGLFASNRTERALWAALMLGRFMPSLIKKQRVAFFLRSNNQLYESLSNFLIDFQFYDLLEPFDGHFSRVAQQNPTVLIAPAQILRLLSFAQIDGRISITPEVVISVAEVASPEDEALVQKAFGRQLDQVYQCTEGVLGMTCREGNLHLNESFLHIEREIIDEKSGAFVPIITDLARETLPIIRYRLDDVLIPSQEPCPCGCHTQRLLRIEGRCDDILYWEGHDGHRCMIPSDAIRQAMASVPYVLRDYRAEQYGSEKLVLSLDTDHFDDVKGALFEALTIQAETSDAKLPSLLFRQGINIEPDRKRRRVIARSFEDFASVEMMP
ncbi:F390 synthetase-related protein [Brucellaceae bacterium C25G]